MARGRCTVVVGATGRPGVGIVIVAVVIMAVCAVMMAERHALPGAYRRRALKGHDDGKDRYQQ